MHRIALQSSRDLAVVLPERFRAGCAFGVARTGVTGLTISPDRSCREGPIIATHGGLRGRNIRSVHGRTLAMPQVRPSILRRRSNDSHAAWRHQSLRLNAHSTQGPDPSRCDATSPFRIANGCFLATSVRAPVPFLIPFCGCATLRPRADASFVDRAFNPACEHDASRIRESGDFPTERQDTTDPEIAAPRAPSSCRSGCAPQGSRHAPPFQATRPGAATNNMQPHEGTKR
jgi:hypothetical protein